MPFAWSLVELVFNVLKLGIDESPQITTLIQRSMALIVGRR